MDIMNFVAQLNNDAAHQHLLHFFIPTVKLECMFCHDYEDGSDLTTYYNEDTGEEIITVPSNIKEISTWSDWDFYFRGGMEITSQHSVIYRLIKAIFDGKIDPKKDPEDAYGTKYVVGPLTGYEIL